MIGRTIHILLAYLWFNIIASFILPDSPVKTVINITGMIAFVLFAFLWLYNRITLRWYFSYRAYGKRLFQSADQNEAVYFELIQKYEAGDHSFPVLIGLASALNNKGLSENALAFIKEARALATQKGACQKTTLSARLMCEVLISTESDALNTLGHHQEAAQRLQAAIPHVYHPNQFTASCALTAYYAGDLDLIRDTLQAIKPGRNNPWRPQRQLAPPYFMVLAYLDYKVNNVDPRPAFKRHQSNLQSLEKTYYMDPHSPAGEKLGTMIAEIKAILNAPGI